MSAIVVEAARDEKRDRQRGVKTSPDRVDEIKTPHVREAEFNERKIEFRAVFEMRNGICTLNAFRDVHAPAGGIRGHHAATRRVRVDKQEMLALSEDR